MKPAEYLYNYAKLYFQYNMKVTLMLENWDDANYDVKNVKFLQEYFSIKNNCIIKNLSPDEIKRELIKYKINRLNFLYDKLYKKMIEPLEKSKGKISPAKENDYHKRLSKYISTDDVNFNYIKELRKIEEEDY
jgi:hypothetical protein